MTEDQKLRAECVGMSLAALQQSPMMPEEVIQMARSFYLFFKGKDPVIDVMMGDDKDDNIVHIENWVLMKDE